MTPARPALRRLLAVSLGVAAVGAAGCVVGLFVDRRQLCFSYLTAYAYVTSIALGALVFLMSCHAMRAGWPVLLRRLTEGMVATFPLLLVLFVPVLCGGRILFEWLHPERIADEHRRLLVEHKAPYLNLPFFLVRVGIYFLLWIIVGELLFRWSRRRDADPTAEVSDKLTGLSAGALPGVGLTLSFAAIDWVMSLSPTWFSTMFPVYFFAGGFVTAIAVLTAATFAADRSGILPGVNASHYYALGRLLLSFTIFWAYTAFFQLLLIWIADKPSEVTFLSDRARGPWLTVSIALILVQFVLPFFALLSHDLKLRRGLLAIVAFWLIAAHYLDVQWMIAPTIRGSGFPYSWQDLAALLAVGGASVAFAAARLRGRPIAPLNDPDMDEALRYDSV